MHTLVYYVTLLWHQCMSNTAPFTVAYRMMSLSSHV